MRTFEEYVQLNESLSDRINPMKVIKRKRALNTLSELIAKWKEAMMKEHEIELEHSEILDKRYNYRAMKKPTNKLDRAAQLKYAAAQKNVSTAEEKINNCMNSIKDDEVFAESAKDMYSNAKEEVYNDIIALADKTIGKDGSDEFEEKFKDKYDEECELKDSAKEAKQLQMAKQRKKRK